MQTRIVELPDRVVAAAGGDDAVWCVAGGRLLAFTEDGAGRLDVPLEEQISALAAGTGVLVAVLASGAVAWIDRASGKVLAQRPVGGAPILVSGGGAVWAIDRATSRAWRVGEPGTLGQARSLPALGGSEDPPLRVADGIAADGDRLWWTTQTNASLRDFERSVDLDVPASETGAMTVCAGSVWISVADGLVRVGAWAAERGRTISAPIGPVPFLTCAGGVLVGASSRGVFVLNPAVDDDARLLDSDTDGELAALVAVGRTAWLFSARRAEARLVTVRA